MASLNTAASSSRAPAVVLEVGAGNGLNFAYYPNTVTEVVAVEPEPYLRRLATRAAREAPVSVQVVDETAEQLPFPDATFDTGVASLVLCSVEDPDRALAELRRVIRPGGELRFYEHVAAEEGRLLRLQRAFDHVWPHLAGGCHSARDTISAIERAGFAIERVSRFEFKPCRLLALPTSPHAIGAARNPVARMPS